MMEAMSVAIKNRRRNVAGSLNTKMPTNTVPTAPIPVQTAYAVPMGRYCVALTSNHMLMPSDTKKPAYHRYMVCPLVSFAFPRQKAKATSKSPAIMRVIQCMY